FYITTIHYLCSFSRLHRGLHSFPTRRSSDLYPGSGEFLSTTVRSLPDISIGIIITCIGVVLWAGSWVFAVVERAINRAWNTTPRDRKSTRLNSSHRTISYAVFCLKKKTSHHT